jgi:ATP-dependent Clp protease ATP-binding subunit ClpA
LFEAFSLRAKRGLFLTRELASIKGTSAILEPPHLLEALVRQDQGEFAARMPNLVCIGNSELRPAHSFFSAETASAVLVSIERILPPKTDPIPTSTDMHVSPTLERIFSDAVELANEQNKKQVEPLHLLASVLSQESEPSSEILRQAGVSRSAMVAAIESNMSYRPGESWRTVAWPPISANPTRRFVAFFCAFVHSTPSGRIMMLIS